MNTRGYVSNLHLGYPIAAQLEALAGVKPVYVDTLRPAARRRKDAADLKERAVLLRPTSRRDGEVIKVMALPCLCRAGADFLAVLEAAQARGATILPLDTGIGIPPDASMALIRQGAEALALAWRAAGLLKGRERWSAIREADTERRARLIADQWPLPSDTHPTGALLLYAGPRPGGRMAYATAARLLGDRPKVQARYEAEQNREAGRVAARERKRQEKADAE